MDGGAHRHGAAAFTSGGSDRSKRRLAADHGVNGGQSRRFLSLKKNITAFFRRATSTATPISVPSTNLFWPAVSTFRRLTSIATRSAKPTPRRWPPNVSPRLWMKSAFRRRHHRRLHHGADLGAGGVIPPHASFMPAVREVCDRRGILLIADEVITGFGHLCGPRSRLCVQPDMMCIAKASGGFSARRGTDQRAHRHRLRVGQQRQGRYRARLYLFGASGRRRRRAPPLPRQGALMSSPTPRRAARSSMTEWCRWPSNTRWSARCAARLMTAMELVADRETKAPIDSKLAIKLQKTAYQAGALIRVSGPNVILSPSLVIEEADIDIALNAVEEGLKAIS